MKRRICILLVLAQGAVSIGANLVHAYIPASAYTQAKLFIYGVFTSSDPLCRSGFVETVKVQSATPVVYDLTRKPNFGMSRLAMPLRCVVLVVKNSMSIVLPPGSYTTSTNGFPDSICNAGNTRIGVLNGSTAQPPIVWPAEIAAVLRSVGLSLTSSLPNPPTGDEVVPLYISSASKCYGHGGIDPTLPGCDPSGVIEYHKPPRFHGDPANGIRFDPPARSNSHRFVMDLSFEMGNDGGIGCGDFAPIFSFR